NHHLMRIAFCQWALQMLHDDPNFFRYVFFSDEATFCSNGQLNRHNCHYWSSTRFCIKRKNLAEFKESCSCFILPYAVWLGQTKDIENGLRDPYLSNVSNVATIMRERDRGRRPISLSFSLLLHH
ncbi:hypothetical protein ALC57_14069, partial [Trachymyrmex cornetzi]